MYCNEIMRILKDDVLIENEEFYYDTDLFETGLMDSLATMHLFIQLEQEFGIKIDLTEIEIENFSTVRKISEYVKNHK